MLCTCKFNSICIYIYNVCGLSNTTRGGVRLIDALFLTGNGSIGAGRACSVLIGAGGGRSVSIGSADPRSVSIGTYDPRSIWIGTDDPRSITLDTLPDMSEKVLPLACDGILATLRCLRLGGGAGADVGLQYCRTGASFSFGFCDTSRSFWKSMSSNEPIG